MNKETKSLLNLITNLAFGIFIPIYILNSPKLPLTPEQRLIVAVLFPLLYGAFEWWQTKKHNFIALLGLINVLITGSFGLLQLEGFWFSVKEATFPFLIGVFVLISGFRGTPVFQKMLLSPELFDLPHLHQKLDDQQKQGDFQKLIQQSNYFLAFSFAISALLNFVIAEKTFLPIDLALDATARANVLNEQIAQMHKRGFLGIAIPSMIMMLGLLAYFLKRTETITGESIDKFMHSPTAPTETSSNSETSSNTESTSK